MRTKLYLLLLFFFPLVWTACENGDGPEGPEEPALEEMRTVLVYMAADNSLAKFTFGDLDELKAGWLQMKNTSGMHLLVYIDTGTPRLVELEKKGTEVVETIVKEYEKRNSVGVAETQEVFDDVFKNPLYQAGSYGLIYWSHGDGWIPYPVPSSRWVGQDTGNGDHRMNIAELTEILQKAPHFDFLMFDACFMQSIEVAYELRDYCDYYIGFPAENPGPGAAYDKMLPFMFQKGMSKEMAAATFEVYDKIFVADKIGTNENWTMGTAIGVLKTSELENLAAATAKALSGIAEADGKTLRSSVFDYDRRSAWSSSHVGYYDFAEMMEVLVTDPSLYADWKQAYAAASVYWATTPMIYSMYGGMFSMERTSGVSHYIPMDSKLSAVEAYRSMDWYKEAGLSQIGW